MILMVYNKQLCREYLLPNLYNSDYELVLPGQGFGLPENLSLRLESGESWILHQDARYRIKKKDEVVEQCTLIEKEILEIHTAEGMILKIIVVDVQLSFHILQKYDLTSMTQVSVGRAEGNIIQYEFREFVSAYHAELTRHSDGWHLTDKSSNGVFREEERLQGNSRLEFADHVQIFGLHLVFLGDTLAVGTYYGQLHVNEEILKRITYSGERPADASANKASCYDKTEYYNRSPRNLPSIYGGQIEIEGPPASKEIKQRPWFLVAGPSFTMAIPMLLGCGLAIWGSGRMGGGSSAFMYTGLITAVGSAVIGSFWAMTNLKYSKSEQIEEEKHRFNAYSNYLIKMTATLQKKYEYNAIALRDMYPPADTCTRYDEGTTQLWNRNDTHKDFLFARIGAGEIPFQMEVRVPPEKFTMQNDSLIEKPEMIRQQFQTLYQVPVGISLLEKQLIGLVGGKYKTGAVELMHSIVAGIAAAHCYTDVKFMFIYDEAGGDKKEVWECMKWFPHVWSQDRQTRFMAADEVEKRDVLFELSNILRARVQETGKRGKSRIAKPYYILFISDPQLLEGELLANVIYEPVPEYGITTFLMVESLEQLPNHCEDIIEKDAYFQGFYNLLEGIQGKNPVQLDKVSTASLEKMGRVLSNIKVKEVENTSEIPVSLDFLSMYGVKTLISLEAEKRWQKNRTYNSMKALIGKKAGNADCYLDVHEKYHGPHGLIAGTTGSGKSETLQTYMLSLALNFSPEDVAFFVIDFKGGGMANLFAGLPHMAGQISNLSGNQIHRAMISIKSENLRRQRLFTEYGVNNINLYTRLYKSHEAKIPIPHLFIIIDEFAELKREEPDFMRELISVAQVGRSLGVHLILATQKPSGTVDDNIWSNSRFRLCLRVQDRQDSNDMLHRPDAAFITQTGRGYLQVGNDEIYELFQSGWSGAPYEEGENASTPSVMMLTRTGRTALVGKRKRQSLDVSVRQVKKQDTTQLQAVTEYLQQVASEQGYGRTKQLWMPVLGNEIVLEEAKQRYMIAAQNNIDAVEKWSLRAPVAVYDDPKNQQQGLMWVDFAEHGNLAVCGAVVSGKSVFLQTLVYSLMERYTPKQLQFYLIDFSSHMLAPFERAPHTGGIVYDNQEDRLGKFMHMLGEIMDERKSMFQGGNYSQYVQAYGQCIPAVLIVIDNLGGMREKSGGRYDDILFRLVREGTGYGIYLAATAAGYGMTEIPGRIADNIRAVMSLEQSDKYKYMDIMRVTRLGVLPEPGTKGRGIANIDGRILEFQTALSIEAEDDFSRGQLLEQFCTGQGSSWGGLLPRRIPEIPNNPTLSDFKMLEEYERMVNDKDMIPLAYELETASVLGVGLKNTYCYTISGRSHTGKTNVLKLLIYGACAVAGQMCIIEPGQTELKCLAEDMGAEYLPNLCSIFQYFEKLTPVFITRNKIKKQLIEAGLDEEEIYMQMKKAKPIFIFLSDIREFFLQVYQADTEVGNMSGFMENIMEKGHLHGIYFFGCLQTEDSVKLSSYRAYNLFTSYKKGVHLGGNLSSQKLFGFQNIHYAELGKSMKRGYGYAADEEDEAMGIKIAIPLARKE